jgi:hypothetical protein
MFNQDIINLYERVPVNTKVVVLRPDAHVEPLEAFATAREEEGPGHLSAVPKP